MAAKKVTGKTPKGWGDWNPTGGFLRKSQKTSKGLISESSLKKTAAFGRGARVAAIELAVGDPKKGARSMAINAATWGLPYGKVFKGVDAAVKGGKVIKSAKAAASAAKGASKATKVVKGVRAGTGAAGKKVVRGAIKGGIILAADTATSKAAGKGKPRPKGKK